MMNEMTKDSGDDFVFAEENDEEVAKNRNEWKILIADDEKDVHVSTKLVLKDFSFRDRNIHFLDAYSGSEVCEILRDNPDIAVVFLDVVMETDDAGLRAVKRIREELGNQMVRIILRTGQPGHAPEDDVVLNYHINDYKAKSEMTSRKLFTSLISALRSYQDLQMIESSRRGLMKILDASSSMDFRSRNLFVAGLLMQLGSLLDLGNANATLIRHGQNGQPDFIIAACGLYDPFIGEPAAEILDTGSLALLRQTLEEKRNCHDNTLSAIHVTLPEQPETVLILDGAHLLDETGLALISIFCQKMALAWDNYDYVDQSRKDLSSALSMLAEISGTTRDNPIAHATDIGRLSSDIARHLRSTEVAMEIPVQLSEIIVSAAMLIDIGHVSIPEGILSTQTPLTSEQKAIIRNHTNAGRAILEKAAQTGGGRVMRLARELALNHHERFDGSGYPQNLKGEQIPLAARIVAVADVYMALTSERPWRGTYGHDDAVSMINDGSGTLFDPVVVRAFCAIADAYRRG